MIDRLPYRAEKLVQRAPEEWTTTDFLAQFLRYEDLFSMRNRGKGGARRLSGGRCCNVEAFLRSLLRVVGFAAKKALHAHEAHPGATLVRSWYRLRQSNLIS